MNLFMIRNWLSVSLSRDERGANLVEYILLVSLIALAVIAAVMFMSGELSGSFDEAGSRLSNAPNP
jgi:Flp pilus assembly pilin Flp